MRVLYPPVPVPHYLDPSKLLFLAGSIEMGKAERWQEKIATSLNNINVTLLNPRRLDWDSSWQQSPDNPEFNKQVNWELNGIERAGLIVFYFDPNTQSPITLMELGYAAGLKKKSIIYCPESFWRSGNVEILVDRNQEVFKMVDSYEELVSEVIKNF